MSWKHWAYILATIAVLALTGIAWGQHIRAVRAEAEVAVLELERLEAVRRADSLEAEAVEVEETVDSLTIKLETEKIESAVTISTLHRELDSLETTLIGFVNVRNQVTAQIVLDSIRSKHRQEVAEYSNLLLLSDETIDALRQQVQAERRISANLREQLRIVEAQAESWARAANPGVLTRLRKDAGLFGGLFVAGVGIGFTLAR